MSIEEYQCDIADVLQNKDFSILQKLSSSCNKFEMYVASKVESATTRASEYTKRMAASTEKISELQQEVEILKSEIDNVKLQQKIVDKKIANIIKQEEKLNNEIPDAKARRDCLSLELVDLKQEIQDRREKKLKNWNAIKRATAIYKSNLNFVINVEENGDFDAVKVLFFRNYESIKDKYYVQLINKDKLWKVKEIHPKLREEHWIDLKGTVDFTNQSQISNVTAFLCLLRVVFLKYYMDSS
ncbi:hypothetical protein KPH14_009464 [Odynerus spinipes]|uniref:Kinetochore protein SPC25 n=1 Tax=Odynerus spinipes TaxID=1348599 RepID=A0AAD9VQZ7_9HYME|nr:hypothetical protein KPH14_009464 [Odynerus spinipes]